MNAETLFRNVIAIGKREHFIGSVVIQLLPAQRICMTERKIEEILVQIIE